jgi:O-antigen/teichoic acid export membrane protein
MSPRDLSDAPRRAWQRVWSRTFGQAAGYAVSEGLITGLAAISTALVARGLSTREFGSLSFAVSFLLLTALFFDFGLFLPAARHAIVEDARGRREVVGAALLAFVPIGILFGLTIFGLSYGVDSWFHVHVGSSLRVLAALVFVYPFQVLGQYLAQGVDRLHIYSITAAAAQALYVVALTVLVIEGAALSVTLALTLRFVGMLIGWGALIVWLRPRFGRAAERVRSLVRDARAYGTNVWVGRLLSIGTYNMDVLMLASFTSARSVGFYALAGSVAYLVGLPVLGMAAALFGRMAANAQIERSWLMLAWISGLGLAAIVSAAAYPVIPFVFSDRYSSAAPLVLPLALAAAVRAVTTIYNQFLQAKGRGKELRNAAFILTGSNVLFNFALIPPFGAMGAAWASLIALACNYAAHVLFYARSLRMPEVETMRS